MFKLQKDLKSMDFNKNLEKYKFITPKTIKILKKPITNEYSGIGNMRANTYTKKNKFPPIYYYKNTTSRYKYSLTSVPEYLIKNNGEKEFINKLYNSLSKEEDKKALIGMLNVNSKKNHLKIDNFKPLYLEVQKLLKYRPQLYNRMSEPINVNEQVSNKLETNTKNNIINNSRYRRSPLIKKEKNDEANLTEINNDKKDKKNFEEISKEDQIKYRYKLSDIFNFRKEPVFLKKSAEKHLFKGLNTNIFNSTCPNMEFDTKILKENKFHISNESKSDWIPNKTNQKTMGTNSSVAYNIICPSLHGTNKFITARELNKDNLYNESPAFRRVKSISEFVDLSRVFATNTLGCFDRTKSIPDFKFNNNIGTNQLDAYHINRDLIEKHI